MAAFSVQGVPGVIAYLRPSHARPDAPMLMIKRPSFPKGQVPAHLRDYLGQARQAPVTCKGRKGQAYRECLIRETAHLRSTEPRPRRPRRRARAAAAEQATE